MPVATLIIGLVLVLGRIAMTLFILAGVLGVAASAEFPDLNV